MILQNKLTHKLAQAAKQKGQARSLKIKKINLESMFLQAKNSKNNRSGFSID